MNVLLVLAHPDPGSLNHALAHAAAAAARRAGHTVDVRRRTYGVVVTSTPEQRRAWLADATALVAEAFPASASCG